MLKITAILEKSVPGKRWIQVLILLALLIPNTSFSQKVHAVKFVNQADVKVFEVAFENQADLLVYKEEFENRAAGCSGNWFFTKFENQATHNIFFVEFENQADLKIFLVKFPNRAGWRNETKKQLLCSL